MLKLILKDEKNEELSFIKEKIAEKDKIIANKENLFKKFFSRLDMGESKHSETEKMGKFLIIYIFKKIK